ncbi:MAG TPA: extracellular solute-binding protein [Thermomicrobiales bacterium]|jgi:multiple sugar transport system substrate-binding protein
MEQTEGARRLSRRQLLKQSAIGATAVAALGVQQQVSAAPAHSSALLAASRFQDRVQILHWSHPLTSDDTKVFNPLIQKFQDAGNNVDVKIELTPWDGRIERNMSAVAAGTSPDTSYLNVDEFTTYADQGALVALDDYITPDSVADFLPGPKDAMTWQDKIYEIPVLHAFRVAYVNTDIWTKSGLDPENTPKTWDDLDAALAKVKAAKDAGTHSAWATSMEGSGSGPTPVLRNFNPWFYQAGGSLVNADGTSGYDSDAGIQAAVYATHLFQTYCSQADRASKGDDLNERFGQGLFAYMNNNELGVIKQMQTDFPNLKFGIANTTSKAKPWTHGGVGCFGMWMPSTKRDATWAWINFLTKDGNLDYNNGFGYVPPRQSVRDEYVKSADPLYQRALQEQQYAGVEKHPRLWDMWDVISPELEAAFAGSKSPEDAVKAAADHINSDILSK